MTSHSVFIEFCRAGLWPGVGPAMVDQLAEAGVETPSSISEETLAGLPRVTDKRAKRLYSAWIGSAHLYAVAQVLVPQGLPVRWAPRLTDYLGDAAADQLRADPWSLLALPDASVSQADSFGRALCEGVTPLDPRRLRALVDRTLMTFARDGHTAAPVDLVADVLREWGVTDADGCAAAIRAAVDADLATLVRDPGGSAEPWIARAGLARAEDDIASHLRRLVAGARPLAPVKAVRAALGDLDHVQSQAVLAAAEHGVSVLTGGPGTGKSRTVTALVRLCSARGVSLALAAPTGRAAKRLSELIAAAGESSGSESSGRDGGAGDGDAGDGDAGDGDATPDGRPPEQAMTIHRLLGARKGSGPVRSTFEHDESNPIDAEMVVIDETSMLDAELAAALLAAIPTGAHLMLVGDPAQLPSIGAGKVLADIVGSGRFPGTDLTTLYRQSEGGAIARLAAAARGGALAAADSPDHEVVIVPATNSAEAQHRVVQLVTDSIPRVFSAIGDNVQVITPVHRGPAGTIALNRALKAVLNPGQGRVRGFDVGDRVVATANHIDAEPTGYANGEVGTVIDAAGKELLVAFPAGESEISGKALGDLVHGWAITVHRAQGSEWDAVVLVLPPEAGRMLSRPLVYTGLTRARRHLSIVHAAGPAVARAVRHVGARPRRTRLESLLCQDGATKPASGRD